MASHFLPSMYATIANNFGFSLCSGWKKAGASRGKYRHVNGVHGNLIKEHYPGMVTLPGEGKVPEPACTWDHYKAYEDLGVANNIEFHNKAERVFAELWVIIKFPSHNQHTTHQPRRQCSPVQRQQRRREQGDLRCLRLKFCLIYSTLWQH